MRTEICDKDDLPENDPGYLIIISIGLRKVSSLVISFVNNSFLMYRNTTDFFMLIFYPSNLTDLCVSSNSFSVAYLVFYAYHVICKQINLLFLSSLDAFYFFSLSNGSGQDFHYYVK